MIDILNDYRDRGLLYCQGHPTLPLTIWNYTEKVQYEGLWDDVTMMCRGLVTDTEGNIMARPFKKFFNMEEGKHTPTSEFDVYEKMDGSLIIVFWCGGWIVASRGSFTSEQALAAERIFFDELDHNFSIGITYLFEFTASWNRIVVDYGEKPKLTLLGAIRTDDGTEATWEELKMIGDDTNCDVVKKYNGISDYTTLKGMIGNNAEGFVVRFSNGDRMKIKGDEYLRLHKIMTCVSTTSVWEVLSNGDDISTILKDVPDEFYKKIMEYSNSLITQFHNIDLEYQKIYGLIMGFDDVVGNRREFAKYATRFDNPAILFKMYDNNDYSGLIWKSIKPQFCKL
jgi:T4 RnlA family RNA ligase